MDYKSLSDAEDILHEWYCSLLLYHNTPENINNYDENLGIHTKDTDIKILILKILIQRYSINKISLQSSTDRGRNCAVYNRSTLL